MRLLSFAVLIDDHFKRRCTTTRITSWTAEKGVFRRGRNVRTLQWGME